MKDLVDAVGQADSVWSVLAIAVIGLYVLVWRFGKDLLALARDSNRVAKEVHTEARTAASEAKVAATEVKSINEQITTNHGSNNLGEAIDKLTEQITLLAKESKTQLAGLKALDSDLHEHITWSTGYVKGVDGRLDELENGNED